MVKHTTARRPGVTVLVQGTHGTPVQGQTWTSRSSRGVRELRLHADPGGTCPVTASTLGEPERSRGVSVIVGHRRLVPENTV